MAVSDVQIAKLALQHIGDRFDITSLTEASTEAEQVNLVFEDVRDALVREHPWKFSLRWTSPSALSGTPPAGWGYQFAYPSDAVRVWRIINPLDPTGDRLDPIPFTVGRSAADVKVLLTNQQEPEFEYSKRVTTSIEFDRSFVMALSYRIAEAIAMPLTGEAAVKDRMSRDSEKWVGAAKQEDGNEGISRKHDHATDWIKARL